MNIAVSKWLYIFCINDIIQTMLPIRATPFNLCHNLTTHIQANN